MSSQLTHADKVNAFLNSNPAFDGVFYTAVITTGIFCRPVCPARKPKPENVEFFNQRVEALRAGYRPCKRCKPMNNKDDIPEEIVALLKAVDSDPTKRWKDQDIRELGLQPATVRRWFQKHHDMTFHTYSRLRRLGTTMKQLSLGTGVTRSIDYSGYESESGFRTAFQKYFGDSPKKSQSKSGAINQLVEMRVNRIASPLGPLLICANDDGLHLLEFVDRRMLETQIKRLRKYTKCFYIPGEHEVMKETEKQLAAYFSRELKDFDLPLQLLGTEFQVQVWKALLDIPFGETRTYSEQATIIRNPKAVRAVGTANGDNRLAVVVPCHRVIGANGKLTGYGGGLWRKERLLEIEK